MCEHVLLNTDHKIIGLDKLTYASNGYNRLRDAGVLDNPRLKIFCSDFSQVLSPGLVSELGEVDYIFHLGAETHVDKSIENPEPFITANVTGTKHMLEFAKKQKNLKKFFYFSTDEVFGPAPEGTAYKEDDCQHSRNPYAATKAGAEQLCFSYENTHKIPLIVTRVMNCFGERQHPEKYIPLVIKKVLDNETVFIHADKTMANPGKRYYIHCRNTAAAMLFLIEKGTIGESYHIVGEKEVDNLALAQFIARVIGKPLKYELIDFHSTRPGHDLRYALDGSKMYSLGWRLPKNFEDSLAKTIQWYIRNPKWLAW